MRFNGNYLMALAAFSDDRKEELELSVEVVENGEYVMEAPEGKVYNKVSAKVAVPFKEEQIKTIDIDFKNGDMQVAADAGKAMSSVRIPKPATLLPENIAEGIEIAGIVGTHVGGSADVRYVTFMNGNTELYRKPVAVGDDCVDVYHKGLIEKPTKESTAQYNYVFYGWGASDGGAADGNILKNITEDKTVYAVFTAVVRTYTITYYDEDGTTVLKTEQVAYGSVPSYAPTKSGYAFESWTPTPVAVTGNASYTAVWGSLIAEGTTANGQPWSLSSSGELHISGTGATPDYSTYTSSKQPWYAYRSQITSAVIDEGITQLGNYTFRECDKLVSVTIPDSVTDLGEYTFSKCTSLTAVDVPNGVTTLKRYLFYQCTNLARVSMPSVTQIQSYVFQECASLITINLPQGLTSIGSNAIYKCAGLTSVTIPNSVTEIGSAAFAESPKLESVNIPTGLATINSHVFNGTAIKTITIPNSVTLIGTNAFANCSNLSGVTFENTTGWILATSSTATSGDAVDVTDTATNATNLVTTYKGKYWKRT